MGAYGYDPFYPTSQIVPTRKKTSLRNHPFWLLARRRWGRFARRKRKTSPAAKSEEKRMFSNARKKHAVYVFINVVRSYLRKWHIYISQQSQQKLAVTLRVSTSVKWSKVALWWKKPNKFRIVCTRMVIISYTNYPRRVPAQRPKPEEAPKIPPRREVSVFSLYSIDNMRNLLDWN